MNDSFPEDIGVASPGAPEASEEASRGYRMARGFLRAWLHLFGRPVRLLQSERLSASGAALLVVSHPASWLDALLLVAAFERPVHCVLAKEFVSGPLRRGLARLLGILVRENGSATVGPEVAALLAEGRAVAIFVEPQPARNALPAGLTQDAAALALEAESQAGGKLGLRVFPVHLFRSPEGARAGEILIYVDAPLRPQEHLAAEGSEPRRRLAWELAMALRQNPFRLEEEQIHQFLRDLENVLLQDWQEEVAAQPNWKQSAEGFKLSRLIEEWAEQENFLDPGSLVRMRIELDTLRENQRRWSLAQFEVEAARPWLDSSGLRTWYWIESALGLPVAAYGLLNHLLAYGVLRVAGLLKKKSARDQATEWALRAGGVLACYAAQVLLCDFLWGRAAAGYYALTLPVSGAYLGRYPSLVRKRTRLLIAARRLARQADQLRRERRALLAKLNEARDAHAELLGILH